MNRYKKVFLEIEDVPSVFWVVISATLINQIGNMAFLFLVIYTTQHLGFSLTQGSIVFAAFSGSMLITGLFGGILIDQLGAVRVMIYGLVANGLTLLLFPLIHNYLICILMCLLWGCISGVYRPASQTLVSHLAPPDLYKVIFSIYRLSLNLGMSIGPAVGGYLAMHSFSSIFLANGIANLLASIILITGFYGSTWLKFREVPQPNKILAFKCLKSDPILRLFMLGMIPILMVFFQHQATLAVFIHEDLNLPLSFYGLIFTVNTLIIVFLELFLTVLIINWSYRFNFILGSFLILIGFSGMYFATLKWHIILLVIAWTFGEMILFPSASSYIAEIAPKPKRGLYMSMFSTSANLGMLLGPWSGAMVMQQFGSRYLWVACGIWGMISVLLFRKLKEPLKD
jgi:MFS family permease